MSKDSVLPTVQTAPAAHPNSAAIDSGAKRLFSVERVPMRHRYFRAIWYSGNILLILAILLAIYSVMWEYSTRRYLKGFSDAVVPESSSAVDKVEAILNWMSRGPARQESDQIVTAPDRDPTDTLNYASLLKVCGSATNAFINLADSAGLTARRLLLLDSRHLTTHVVAEVLIDGRWIVVDPAFRMIPRGSGGRLLTREDLADPATLSAATRGVAGYSPSYTFDRAVHIRVSRLRYVGPLLRTALDRLLPGWEDSAAASLLLERESLATMVVALAAVFLFAILRVALRWYGEKRLGVRPVRIRQQVRRAFYAFVHTAG
jgi:hypothetical protein